MRGAAARPTEQLAPTLLPNPPAWCLHAYAAAERRVPGGRCFLALLGVAEQSNPPSCALSTPIPHPRPPPPPAGLDHEWSLEQYGVLLEIGGGKERM